MKKLVCKGIVIHNSTDTFGRFIESKGVRLDRYAKNGVILLDHGKNNKTQRTPIGVATSLTKQKDGVTFVTFEVLENMTPAQEYTGIKTGVIKGISAGVARDSVKQVSVVSKGITDYIATSQLLEITVCSIPRNMNCLITEVTEEEVADVTN